MEYEKEFNEKIFASKEEDEKRQRFHEYSKLRYIRQVKANDQQRDDEADGEGDDDDEG